MGSQVHMLISELCPFIWLHLLDLYCLGICNNITLCSEHISLVSGFANVRAFIWGFINFDILKTK
ncbi:unnamed protein product [Gulo gulo]|uniref:Uncharacterized protein n=1 Tax=Gulo gulo TaxID=48420 RepID=A0A9X9PWN1_GULGU|nr:unnamed protein product [Gulo gulo]